MVFPDLSFQQTILPVAAGARPALKTSPTAASSIANRIVLFILLDSVALPVVTNRRQLGLQGRITFQESDEVVQCRYADNAHVIGLAYLLDGGQGAGAPFHAV